MLKISEAANLAIHAMAYLASLQEDKFVSVTKIASHLTCSPSHLAKVLNQLVRQDMLVSSRGAQGGFRLPDSSKDLTALQVLEAVDGPFQLQGCLLGEPICQKNICIFGDLYEEVRQRLVTRFQEVKVGDIHLNSVEERLPAESKPGDEK